MFDLGQVAAWREAWAERRGAEKSSPPTDIEDGKRRLIAAQARQEELKLELMQKRLMTTEEYERLGADLMARFDAKLRYLPQRIAAVHWSTDMTERVRQAAPLVDDVRAELYQGQDLPEEVA